MSHRLFKKLHRQVSFLLILLFLFESLLFKAGEEFIFAAENTDVIEITSEDDLLELSEKAGDGTYTVGKVFRLKKDLDLTGMDFFPVQAFAGTFDGEGHTIRGFYFVGDMSGGGFFRTVIEGAEIRNLKLDVELQPNGSMKNIGGITGINEGVIILHIRKIIIHKINIIEDDLIHIFVLFSARVLILIHIELFFCFLSDIVYLPGSDTVCIYIPFIFTGLYQTFVESGYPAGPSHAAHIGFI